MRITLKEIYELEKSESAEQTKNCATAEFMEANVYLETISWKIKKVGEIFLSF
jgi:hypothetical protein